MRRKVIQIDRELCDGCALCTKACAEGALVIDQEGKASLVSDPLCDGIGACLDVCPRGALRIVEREAEAFDQLAARGKAACPSSHAMEFSPMGARRGEALTAIGPASPSHASELSQWPIQLRLLSADAPYFDDCDLLIAADCTAFALGAFHGQLLRGRRLAIACPKLDDCSDYQEKLTAIILRHTIRSITLAIMEVPCCSGLKRIVGAALSASGKDIAIQTIVVRIKGGIA